jgi:hypothetical protein
MKQKALIAVGTDDESFIAEKFQPEVSQYKDDIEVVMLEVLTHIGVVIGKEIQPIIKEWMAKID